MASSGPGSSIPIFVAGIVLVVAVVIGVIYLTETRESVSIALLPTETPEPTFTLPPTFNTHVFANPQRNALTDPDRHYHPDPNPDINVHAGAHCNAYPHTHRSPSVGSVPLAWRILLALENHRFSPDQLWPPGSVSPVGRSGRRHPGWC
jgi:hypothetical protein